MSISQISNWKKLKRNGNFRKRVKDSYQRIINLSKDTDNQIVARSSSTAKLESISTDLEHQNVNSSSSESHGLQLELGTYDKGSANVELVDLSDEEDTTELSEISKNIKVNQRIRLWASCNISHFALRELFIILNDRIPNLLPKDPRTLLQTARKINLIKMTNGYYWHFRLKINLLRLLENVSTSLDSISLNINLDGLPIFKFQKRILADTMQCS
ncbi:unnamed protein product [Brassicogethes aeneus]|uniref:Uncharacterized protein n=1 Tax=Brassicogethes aeneus TaxID=1431903 RepID=A0A9P0ARJ8_BRAAE|nr:unnamed protein product [Brassicogethes aeneus]